MLGEHLIRGVIADLVVSVLNERRQPTLARDEILARDMLWQGGCELDSLERLDAASAVAEFFDLYETGHEDLLLVRNSVSAWAGIVAKTVTEPARRVRFSTSGTTGKPVRVEHSWASLKAEIADLAPMLAGRRRVVVTVPTHHIYGFLWGALLPDMLGLPVLSLRSTPVSGWARRLAPGDLVVGIPTLLARWAACMDRPIADLAVLSSTQALAPESWEQLKTAEIDRVIELYGSTETGGIAWRDAAGLPLRLMARWRREGDNAIRAHDGAGAPTPLPDRVEWMDDTAFRVLGRHDSIAKVSGIRVSTDRVRSVIGMHPLIEEAAVRAMREHEGHRLKAFVVPKNGGSQHVSETELIDDLAKWAAERLRPEERPGNWTVGHALPRNAMGKPADWHIGPA